jgi:hypothetical protein
MLVQICLGDDSIHRQIFGAKGLVVKKIARATFASIRTLPQRMAATGIDNVSQNEQVQTHAAAMKRIRT